MTALNNDAVWSCVHNLLLRGSSSSSSFSFISSASMFGAAKLVPSAGESISIASGSEAISVAVATAAVAARPRFLGGMFNS